MTTLSFLVKQQVFSEYWSTRKLELQYIPMKWNAKYLTQDIYICYVAESFCKGSGCHSWLNSHINNLPISTYRTTGLLFHIKYGLYEYDCWHNNKEEYLQVKTKQMLICVSLLFIISMGFATCFDLWLGHHQASSMTYKPSYLN
jgi:hypothetical protein